MCHETLCCSHELVHAVWVSAHALLGLLQAEEQHEQDKQQQAEIKQKHKIAIETICQHDAQLQSEGGCSPEAEACTQHIVDSKPENGAMKVCHDFEP